MTKVLNLVSIYYEEVLGYLCTPENGCPREQEGIEVY